MLTKIKKRCGIAESITIYDDEIESLIEAAKTDMIQGGVSKEAEGAAPDQYLNCISCYVKAYLGNDRTDTSKYIDLYEKMRTRITLEC